MGSAYHAAVTQDMSPRGAQAPEKFRLNGHGQHRRRVIVVVAQRTRVRSGVQVSPPLAKHGDNPIMGQSRLAAEVAQSDAAVGFRTRGCAAGAGGIGGSGEDATATLA